MIRRTTILIGLGAMLATAAGCQLWQLTRRQAASHYVTALNYQQAQLHEEAVAELHRAVIWSHDFTMAYSLLGEAYESQGEYEKAAKAYGKACRLDPWSFADHMSLGRVYRTLERLSDAIVAFRRACTVDPQSTQANYELSVCYFESEQYEEAARFAARAAELSPEDETILAALGDTYNKAGDSYQAINAYKQALDQAPGAVDIMLRLGTTYLGMERYEPAEAILRKATQTAPDDTEPHLALAFCLLRQGQRDGALAAYERVVDIEGDNCKGLNGVGVALMSIYLEDSSQKAPAKRALESWHRSLELNRSQPQIEALVEKYTREVNAANSPLQ